jgi:hypothetical protein
MYGLKRLRFSVPWAARCAAAAAVGLIVAAEAQAFFFKGWPGDGLPRERTLIPPGANTPGNPPPPNFWIEEPPEPPPGNQSPPEIPEPSTVLLAAVGAGVVALARRRRKKARSQ